MLKITISFIILLASFVYAQETDVIYLEQNITTSGAQLPTPATIIAKSWIAKNMVRIEQAGQTIIVKYDEENVYTLIEATKQYMLASFQEMEKFMQLGKMMMKSDTAKIVFKETGEENSFNSWNAYQISAQSENRNISIWLSSEVPIERSQIIKMYQKIPGMSSMVSVMEESQKFPGFPVSMHTEMTVMGNTITVNMELIKAEKTGFEERLFIIPDDFTQIPNPFKQ
jgi:hypothetical protein